MGTLRAAIVVLSILATVLNPLPTLASGLPSVTALEDNAGRPSVDARAPRTLASGDPGQPDGDPGTGWIRDRLVGNGYAADVAVAGNGTLWSAVSYYGVAGPSGIAIHYSVDGGYTWVAAPGIGGGPPDPDLFNASIAVDVFSNQVYVAYERSINATVRAIGVAYSADPVLGWSNTTVHSAPGIFDFQPDIAVEYDFDALNYAYIVYASDVDGAPVGAGNTNIDMGVSSDDGATWNLLNIDGLLDTVQHDQPAVAYGNGFLYIAHRFQADSIMEATYDVGSGLMTFAGVAPATPTITWSEPDVAVTRDGVHALVVFTGTEVAPNPTTYISGSNSTDQGVTWSSPFLVSTGPGLESGASVTADYMSWTWDTIAGSFHVVFASDDSVTLSLSYARADSASVGLWTPDLRISDLGHPMAMSGPLATAVTTQSRGLFTSYEYPVALFQGIGFLSDLYWATTPGASVLFNTDPPGIGLSLVVDGVNYALGTPAPIEFSWPAYTFHVVDAPSPQLTVPGDHRYVWREWNDSLPQAHLVFQETATGAYQVANFTRQWWITLDTVPAGLDVTVDGATYPAPHSEWWNESMARVIDTPSPQEPVNGTRYLWSTWSDLGAQNHAVAVTAATTLVANFTDEYLTTLGTSPSGFPLLVDLVSYPASPVYLWSPVGGVHNIEAPQYLLVAPDVRLNFSFWDDAGARNHDITVLGPGTIIATYAGAEYWATVDTDPTGNPVTVDDVLCPATPCSYWWVDGSFHTVDAPAYVQVAPGWRKAWTQWSDLGTQNHTFQVTAPVGTLLATYGLNEYLITIDTAPAGLAFTVDGVPYTSSVALWWPESSLHWTNTTSPQGGGSTRYAFGNWSVGSPALQNLVGAAAPMNITANFVTQHAVVVDTQPTGLWFQVDAGAWYAAQRTLWFDEGSAHDLTVNATQSGLNFTGWTDGIILTTRPITVNSPASYTANYTSSPVPFNAIAGANVSAGPAPLMVGFTSSAVGGDPPYTWDWDFGDGIGTSALRNPPYTYGTPGTYTANVTVRDSGTNSTVIPVPITVTVAPLVLDSCTVDPATATLGISGTQLFVAHGWDGTVEIPGGSLTVVWSEAGGVGTITSGGLFTASAEGAGSADAAVTLGASTVSCGAAVTVVAGPPSVAISTPRPGTVVTLAQVTVNGTATNATSVDVRAGGGAWFPATGVSPWTILLSLAGLPNGPVLLEARAWNGTTESTWAPVTIQWSPPANGVPTADAGLDQLSATKRAPVTLNGSGSTDPDGDVLAFSWRLLSGPTVTLGGALTAVVTFTPTLPGIYVFELTVDDANGGSDTDVVQVIVINRDPVVTGTAPGGTVADTARGSPITFSITVSDPDGDGLTYEWRVEGVVQAGSNTSTFPYGAAAVGTYRFNVTVRDGDGGVAYHEWTLTVTEGTPVVGPPVWVFGVILALVIGVLLLLFLLRRRRKKEEGTTSAAAEVPISGTAEPPSAPPETPTETPEKPSAPEPAKPVDAARKERLDRLHTLREQGLLTPEEFAQRQRELLDGL